MSPCYCSPQSCTGETVAKCSESGYIKPKLADLDSELTFYLGFKLLSCYRSSLGKVKGSFA
mgnify:CR=1 FL=1